MATTCQLLIVTSLNTPGNMKHCVFKLQKLLGGAVTVVHPSCWEDIQAALAAHRPKCLLVWLQAFSQLDVDSMLLEATGEALVQVPGALGPLFTLPISLPKPGFQIMGRGKTADHPRRRTNLSPKEVLAAVRTSGWTPEAVILSTPKFPDLVPRLHALGIPAVVIMEQRESPEVPSTPTLLAVMKALLRRETLTWAMAQVQAQARAQGGGPPLAVAHFEADNPHPCVSAPGSFLRDLVDGVPPRVPGAPPPSLQTTLLYLHRRPDFTVNMLTTADFLYEIAGDKVATFPWLPSSSDDPHHVALLKVLSLFRPSIVFVQHQEVGEPEAGHMSALSGLGAFEGTGPLARARVIPEERGVRDGDFVSAMGEAGVRFVFCATPDTRTIGDSMVSTGLVPACIAAEKEASIMETVLFPRGFFKALFSGRSIRGAFASASGELLKLTKNPVTEHALVSQEDFYRQLDVPAAFSKPMARPSLVLLHGAHEEFPLPASRLRRVKELVDVPTGPDTTIVLLPSLATPRVVAAIKALPPSTTALFMIDTIPFDVDAFVDVVKHRRRHLKLLFLNSLVNIGIGLGLGLNSKLEKVDTESLPLNHRLAERVSRECRIPCVLFWDTNDVTPLQMTHAAALVPYFMRLGANLKEVLQGVNAVISTTPIYDRKDGTVPAMLCARLHSSSVRRGALKAVGASAATEHSYSRRYPITGPGCAFRSPASSASLGNDSFLQYAIARAKGVVAFMGT